MQHTENQNVCFQTVLYTCNFQIKYPEDIHCMYIGLCSLQYHGIPLEVQNGTLSFNCNFIEICSSIELYGREHELRTIPLEPLVVLWFSQRPHRRWQTGARRFHSPTRAVCSASSTDTAARRKSWNSQSVAASTGFSRSKMLPIQPRNPIWTSLAWVMWLFAHSESGFCIYCLEGSLVPFWWGLSLARLTPFAISFMTSPTVVPDTDVLFLATTW